MRRAILVLTAACGSSTDPATEPAHPPPPPVARADAGIPAHASYDDLATALARTIPEDARVIGFGEYHARTDVAPVKSALARFTTDGLPAIGARTSDLIVETYIPDPKCGTAAAETTAKVEITTRRPIETKNEITLLAEAARAAKIQPHAMRVTCDDYAKISPPGKGIDHEVLLVLTTRELGRIATEAVAHRDREPDHRPWIVLYGGALHNDRFPAKDVTDLSYAAKVDDATHGHFVEIDLIVPELAGDDQSKTEPWYPLVAAADNRVHVWKRGERSFVIVLARAVKP